MSKLLLKLRNVPDDEANEVRALLESHDIEYFETSAGNWGISMPGLWLHKPTDFKRARTLINIYQAARASRAREHYLALREVGNAPTTWQLLRKRPLVFGLQVLALLLFTTFAVRLFPGL